mmetsp:Transcript_17458/g.16671  ORF Transcript_17458/g.16671 Transcript_17458/m.16671 type:complete len:84 (-) Transcript_17458:6-257(-)
MICVGQLGRTVVRSILVFELVNDGWLAHHSVEPQVHSSDPHKISQRQKVYDQYNETEIFSDLFGTGWHLRSSKDFLYFDHTAT